MSSRQGPYQRVAMFGKKKCGGAVPEKRRRPSRILCRFRYGYGESFSSVCRFRSISPLLVLVSNSHLYLLEQKTCFQLRTTISEESFSRHQKMFSPPPITSSSSNQKEVFLRGMTKGARSRPQQFVPPTPHTHVYSGVVGPLGGSL